MAVLVTADVRGQTQEGFDGMIGALRDTLENAPGFILVTGYPADGSWRTLEVWDSVEAATAFYATFVHPNLPPGLKPKRTFHPLQTLVSAATPAVTGVSPAPAPARLRRDPRRPRGRELKR